MILVDTNIPLRIAQPGHPHRQPALEAIRLLAAHNAEEFAIAPQSIYEMYVVMTRPQSANGLGYTPEQGYAEIVQVRSLFSLLPETPQVYHIWEDLVRRYAVQGKPAHDARIAAMMIANGVPRVLTFNDADFVRFTEITALNPFDVLGLPRA